MGRRQWATSARLLTSFWFSPGIVKWELALSIHSPAMQSPCRSQNIKAIYGSNKNDTISLKHKKYKMLITIVWRIVFCEQELRIMGIRCFRRESGRRSKNIIDVNSPLTEKGEKKRRKRKRSNSKTTQEVSETWKWQNTFNCDCKVSGRNS